MGCIPACNKPTFFFHFFFQNVWFYPGRRSLRLSTYLTVPPLRYSTRPWKEKKGLVPDFDDFSYTPLPHPLSPPDLPQILAEQWEWKEKNLKNWMTFISLQLDNELEYCVHRCRLFFLSFIPSNEFDKQWFRFKKRKSLMNREGILYDRQSRKGSKTVKLLIIF